MSQHTDRPGYVLAVAQITDMDRFLGEYVPAAGEAMQRYDGEVLVSSVEPDVIEGDWDHNLTFLAKFPSVAAAEDWYADEGYKAAKEIREEISEYTHWIHLPEFSPDAIA